MTATFSPLPTLARLMSVTGDMPVGVVLLAPFYRPVLLAEQLGTLAAVAAGPLIVTFVLGGRPRQFAVVGMEEKSRVGRHAGGRDDQPAAAGAGGDPARRQRRRGRDPAGGAGPRPWRSGR